MLSDEEFGGIKDYLLKVFGKINLEEDEDKTVAMLTAQDKKNRENKVLCVLLDGIGNAKWDCEISAEEVMKSLAYYRSA